MLWLLVVVVDGVVVDDVSVAFGLRVVVDVFVVCRLLVLYVFVCCFC